MPEKPKWFYSSVTSLVESASTVLHYVAARTVIYAGLRYFEHDGLRLVCFNISGVASAANRQYF